MFPLFLSVIFNVSDAGIPNFRSAIIYDLILKVLILFNRQKYDLYFPSNGLAIWHGFSDIIKKTMADNLPF